MVKILIVDDDFWDREYVRDLLKSQDYEVEEAGDGSSAIELLEDHSDFDLMITDLNMKRVHGNELVAHVRGGYPSIKILMRTTWSKATLLENGWIDRRTALIEKSCTDAEFLARVRKFFR